MNFLEKQFQLKENGTNVRTEFIAGVTTFFTMAYIIFVNPSMLAETGMPEGGVYVATILAAVIATLIMGLVANVPYAQAPGMGLNAFFTYTVCFGMGFTWQQALAMVFICCVINIVITATQIRTMIIKAIPKSLQYAIGGGIGLLLPIGFINAGFIGFEGGIPALVDFTDVNAQLALIGLVITAVLMILKLKGSILIGIAVTTLIGILMGVTNLIFLLHSIISLMSQNLLCTGYRGLFADPEDILVLTTILAFSLSDTFDTIGTFIGTGRKSGIFDDKDEADLFRVRI